MSSSAASSSSSSTALSDAPFERYSISARLPPDVPNMYHMVKFISRLPLAESASSSAAASSSYAAPRLAYPFSSATRLCTPRHYELRTPFVTRKRVAQIMTAASSLTPDAASSSGSATGGSKDTAASSSSAAVTASGEVDPLDRKWRLEDPRQSSSNHLSYTGHRDVEARKEAHQAQAYRHVLLLRREGKFYLVPYESYSFRHDEGTEHKLTLEEAEHMMKQKLRRFEKRTKAFASLIHADEDDGGAGRGDAADGVGSVASKIYGARPTQTTRQSTSEKEERADDAFADIPSSGARKSVAAAGAAKVTKITRAVKIRREAGADYTETFDDDDVDFNDDIIDGILDGDNDQDETEQLLEAVAADAQQAAARAYEKSHALAIAGRSGMSLHDVERITDAYMSSTTDVVADGEDDDHAASVRDVKGKRGVKREAGATDTGNGNDDDGSDSDIDDDDDDDEDFSLSDDDDDDMDATPTSANNPAAAAAQSVSRKRPSSPAVGTANNAAAVKRARTDSPAFATASSSSAAAAPSQEVDIASMEQVVLQTMRGAPVDGSAHWTTQSLVRHLTQSYPALFHKQSAGALKDILKKIVRPIDKLRIELKPAFSDANTAAAASAADGAVKVEADTAMRD